ncbi:hypothetical protein [Psychroserpens luteolus]|uniref:hypothetical protein n=1 Tax=Psychroserpens luteolus TaxID=2855840 RepID=UPI001E3B51CE|nr:hypothetical protein [Psychroserpens luteolus]MCD2259774.1 hypothetical protein [Psychroserpens luteolus]
MENKVNVFEKFNEGNLMIDDITDISSFSYYIRFTEISSLSEQSVKSTIADLCISEIITKLKEEKLFNFDDVKVDLENNIKINYSDDIFGFQLEIGKNYYGFQRSGSNLNNFLKTVDKFFDFFVNLYRQVSTYIEGLASNIIFIPYSCHYNFQFQLENFKPTNKTQRKQIPNYELMERIIPAIGSKSSPISKVGFDSRGRTDIKVSGKQNISNIIWLTWLDIMAPSNQNWSTIDVTLEFQSRVTTQPDGSRIPFDTNSIEAWKDIFLVLLKEKIFNGFLKDWLNDVSFKSIR